MTRTLQTLLTGLFDYAGLFPPAKLPMSAAVEEYNRQSRSPDSWMLNRFICPVSRLEEFSETARYFMPGTFATSGYQEMNDRSEPWRVSAIIDGQLNDCIRRIDEFNERHADAAMGQGKVDAIELRAESPSWIDDALDGIPNDLHPAFEVPIGRDPRGFVAALAGNESAAKVRCGGVTPEAFPTSEQLAAFIHACVSAGVPFKATAGLHHPVRAEHRLTYEENPPRGVMHGFLNLAFAAAAARAKRASPETTIVVLETTDPAAFRFEEDRASWRSGGRSLELDALELAKVRETFFLSIGSCSFQEPLDDLRKLGLM